ncbi:hypothetical protein FPSE_07808 [Fusarium pseudograminearum CS3096]|uniref:Uncharacterized protein n=1 Tax=Fusarium pseudograminearum (strain CS3096) TaxID=1028729 RepID=K3VGF6_FUSPC|nr:hypothetical protein FPSE_07808 [Fusarium pseudograminearum CS3096]EKJ72013.1 hypothetical protein FPSE_07808 [Fusarium pseudograminearum CS3096]
MCILLGARFDVVARGTDTAADGTSALPYHTAQSNLD